MRTLDAIKAEIVDEFGHEYPVYSLLIEWVDAEKAAVLADLRAKVEGLPEPTLGLKGGVSRAAVLSLLDPV